MHPSGAASTAPPESGVPLPRWQPPGTVEPVALPRGSPPTLPLAEELSMSPACCPSEQRYEDNHDEDEVVGDAVSSERPGMYLWICHREDYDELDYWPSDQAHENEKLEGRMASIKREATVRGRRLATDVAAVKRRSDAILTCMQAEMSSLRAELAAAEIRAATRLARLEQILLPLAEQRTATGLSASSQLEAQGTGCPTRYMGTAPSTPTRGGPQTLR